jgi:hydrogenase 3 maturation protease
LTAKDSRRLKIFLGGAVPENITGQIKRFSPDHLIVIDAADIGKKAGAFAVFNPQDDITGISFSTHRLPLRILLEYLSAFFEYRATIIGIQPKRHDLYGSVSPEIARSASRIAVAIRQAVGQVRA